MKHNGGNEPGLAVESKHPAISDELRRRIFRDGIAGRLPSIRALADEFSVNKTTVCKALESLAEEGLVRSEQGRGYFVSRRKTRSVILLVYGDATESNGFYQQIAGKLVDGLTKRHLRYEICYTNHDTGGRAFPAPDEISKDRNKTVMTVGVQNRRHILSLMDAGFPVVAFDYVPADPSITAVAIDGVTSGAEATRYLLASGAREVAYIGVRRGKLPEIDSLTLELGYRLAMEEEGLRPRSAFATRNNLRCAGEALDSLLAGGPVPGAIFSANTQLTQFICEACEARGKRVPAALNILSFGGCYNGMPGMEIDLDKYCRAALDLVKQRVTAKEFTPRQVLVRAKLVEATR